MLSTFRTTSPQDLIFQNFPALTPFKDSLSAQARTETTFQNNAQLFFCNFIAVTQSTVGKLTEHNINFPVRHKLRAYNTVLIHTVQLWVVIIGPWWSRVVHLLLIGYTTGHIRALWIILITRNGGQDELLLRVQSVHVLLEMRVRRGTCQAWVEG